MRPVLFDQFQFVHGSRLVRGYISDEQYLQLVTELYNCISCSPTFVELNFHETLPNRI